jgi:hydrogenase-4 component B
MAPLAMGCLFIGVSPMTLLPLLRTAVGQWAPALGGSEPSIAPQAEALSLVSLISMVLILAVAGLFMWLRRTARNAPRNVSTWGCGYAFPSARMQYTASSFADGLVGWFRFGLLTRKSDAVSCDLFPADGHFHSHTPDGVLDQVLYPLFRNVEMAFVWFRSRVQNGIVSFYLLSVTLTLAALLIYSF